MSHALATIHISIGYTFSIIFAWIWIARFNLIVSSCKLIFIIEIYKKSKDIINNIFIKCKESFLFLYCAYIQIRFTRLHSDACIQIEMIGIGGFLSYIYCIQIGCYMNRRRQKCRVTFITIV